LRELQGEVKGAGLKIGVVISRFNPKITDRLLEGALRGLEDAGVAREDITVVSVPGAVEIPGAASRLVRKVDAVVTLGAVVRGETEHFTYVCKAAQEGVVRVALESGKPVLFGVLTTETSAQALDRTGGAKGHKGYEVARDAVEMANLYRMLEDRD
jgi:6,7-dimethyl-8-ribityllumazine synthase